MRVNVARPPPHQTPPVRLVEDWLQGIHSAPILSRLSHVQYCDHLSFRPVGVDERARHICKPSRHQLGNSSRESVSTVARILLEGWDVPWICAGDKAALRNGRPRRAD